MLSKNITKSTIIVIVCALIFFALSMPFRILCSDMGLTEVRPAAALNPLFGLIFGIPGALGCALGNLIADICSGYGVLMNILGILVQFIYGFIPYVMWKRSGSEVRLDTSSKVLRYIIIVLLDSLITALLLGVLTELSGIENAFPVISIMVVLNDFVFCVIIGIPMIMAYSLYKLKKVNKNFSLNERLLLQLLVLAVISAIVIGFVAYDFSDGVNQVSAWIKIYIYISVDIFIFTFMIMLFVRHSEKKITIPLEKLSNIATDCIDESGTKKLNTAKIVSRCKEIVSVKGEPGELADAFIEMSHDLDMYIKNFQNLTKEKERIGAELEIATRIQVSMLPCTFPPYPDRKEFDLYATMTPAKEVGGDFYDFFFIDDDHFAMVMADVSGKGVPAALFMVNSKSLIKNIAQSGGINNCKVEDILTNVNRVLCENNDADMFVTVWLGVIELSTGKLYASNAGHEYPVIKRAGEDFELYKDKHGLFIAGMPMSKYTSYELQLKKGDMLYLYTDGVPEATNGDNQLFELDRMIEVLNKNKNVGLEELLRNVKKGIDEFVGDAPQFDDITMLAFRYNGPNNKE